MKMKKFLLFVILIFAYSVNAQDANTNMSKENRELLTKLKKEEALRVTRVNSYLENNPNAKATIVNDGFTILYIYDIINGKPIYRSNENLQAARATKTNDLWNGGSLGLSLDGSAMTVGVWDGGPAQDTHPEFQNATNTGSRVIVVDNTTVDGSIGFSDHGTHVTGTIAAKGVNANAKGMAPNVTVKSYNWSNDDSEIVAAINDVSNPMILSNHSYGVPVDQDGTQLDASFIGAYTSSARVIDEIVKNNPQYLHVASAGNAGAMSTTGGLYSGYDKLTTDKNAKNTLVVANANPVTVEQPLFSGIFELSNLSINSGSSQGPTDDLRIKPDIAADGTNLLSSTTGGTYSTYSGTSMAAPNTTGALILLQQYYNQLHGNYMLAATLKGLVCHTSIDDDVVIGPDPKFGWGFLNARESAQTITDANNSEAVIDELTLDQGGTYTFTFAAQAGEKLSATICWTDMPGIISNGTVNDPTPRLVNDLDLRISDGTTTYLPWKLDFSPGSGFSNSKADNIVDNIERVDIETPTTGTYTITVTHKGTLQGNVGGPFDPQSQDFSLIVTGSNLTLGTNDLTLEESLKIWPNPTDSELNFRFNSANASSAKIKLIDIQGRTVYSNLMDSNNSIIYGQINTSQFNTGMYFLSIEQGNSKTHKKVVIK